MTSAASCKGLSDTAREPLLLWLERTQRLHGQRPKDKGKLYALHAPEVECIGKGKARQPYEFGVKVGVRRRYADRAVGAG